MSKARSLHVGGVGMDMLAGLSVASSSRIRLSIASTFWYQDAGTGTSTIRSAISSRSTLTSGNPDDAVGFSGEGAPSSSTSGRNGDGVADDSVTSETREVLS